MLCYRCVCLEPAAQRSHGLAACLVMRGGIGVSGAETLPPQASPAELRERRSDEPRRLSARGVVGCGRVLEAGAAHRAPLNRRKLATIALQPIGFEAVTLPTPDEWGWAIGQAPRPPLHPSPGSCPQ